VDVLRGLSFKVHHRDFFFITGPSGAGKTTLIKVLLGMEPVNQGSVLLDGRNLDRLPRNELPQLRRRLGVVFQDFRLLQNHTAFQNVALPLEVSGCAPGYIRKKVNQVLRFVRLEKKAQTPCCRLSGGEQQRVAVARAAVNDPLLLLADEPTGNLDAQASQEVLTLLVSLNTQGTTVIVATHDRTFQSLVPGSRVGSIEGGVMKDLTNLVELSRELGHMEIRDMGRTP
jgi:cell division transport system ATP-binding protein